MPSFDFTAIDATGREHRGTLEAPTVERASAEMKQLGLFPTRLRPASRSAEPSADAAVAKPSRAPLVIGRAVSAQGLAEFTRQLGTLVQAGLPLLRALRVLERQERRPAFRFVIGELAAAIVAGETLSVAMARHCRVFPPVYTGMVRAGEAGGRLEVALLQLARFLEKSERIRRRVKAALYYPAAVLTVTVLILAGLMVFVVPRFRVIFHEQLRGAELPALTRAVLAASDFVGANIGWIILGAAVLAGVRAVLGATARGRLCFDEIALRTPGLGGLRRKTAVARFARTLGTLLGNGVPILAALEVARDTAGGAVFATALDRVRAQVQSGATTAVALAEARRFPELLVNMVAVGEETGTLAEMLGRVADAYEEEVDAAVGGLTALLEPLLIVFLALTVGTIVIALFLPIVRIIQTMS
ncbi:MAG TPA: type II secretion system F family protein [Opitutaceae bacterium]|nr:type II secretion system F family protein [Opitutaceae bacterium]